MQNLNFKENDGYIIRNGKKINWFIYSQYIRSTTWKKKAKLNKEKNNFKCERCGSQKSLRTHHKTYKRVFKEKENDLECLCNICHYKEHNHEPDK